MDIIAALLVFALAVFISSTTLDASVDSVGLPQDFSRFDTFTQAMYDSIFAKNKCKDCYYH